MEQQRIDSGGGAGSWTDDAAAWSVHASGVGTDAKVLAGAIKANPSRCDRLQGAQVLLVDDVLTSGATTNACKDALKAAGAGRVHVACFSRVLEAKEP